MTPEFLAKVTEWIVMAFTKKTGVLWETENHKFGFEHTEFANFLRYPRGYVKQAAGYMGLELRSEV